VRDRGQTSVSPAHDYAPDIDLLRDQLATLIRRWYGVAPRPPSLSKAVEELTAAVEELETMNADLTQSRDAALASQQRYQELFDGIPEAYLVTDVDGLIQEGNLPAEQLFNLDRSQLRGLPLAAFIAYDTRRAFRPHLPGYGPGPRCGSGSSVCSRAMPHPCQWSAG
jgi:PAS domain-containing protein